MKFDSDEQPPNKRENWDNTTIFIQDFHIHYQGWTINWSLNENPTKHDIWIDDPNGDCCFEYKACGDFTKGVGLARRAVRAVIEQNAITMQKVFDSRSGFGNSLTRQIWRSDEGLDPLLKQPEDPA